MDMDNSNNHDRISVWDEPINRREIDELSIPT